MSKGRGFHIRLAVRGTCIKLEHSRVDPDLYPARTGMAYRRMQKVKYRRRLLMLLCTFTFFLHSCLSPLISRRPPLTTAMATHTGSTNAPTTSETTPVTTFPNGRLAGKVAIVTGGAVGFGAGTIHSPFMPRLPNLLQRSPKSSPPKARVSSSSTLTAPLPPTLPLPTPLAT
jgi:hypothetical protein